MLIVWLVVFIDLLGFGIVLPVMPRQAEPYLTGLSPEGRGVVIGILFSVFSLMQFVFSPVWGRISDRIGRRPVLLISLLGSVVFYALYGYAVTLPADQAMLAIGLLYSPMFFRVSRAASLVLLRAQYVEAAELFGAGRLWILRTHLWSKILPTIAVTAAQAGAECLLAVQSLSFLGIGVQPPAPTWGGMLADDLGFLSQQPWAPLIPALTIMITVGALNAIADAIGDSADLPVDASPAESGSPQEVPDALAVR